jgi:glycerol-3-phosphate dehydrogenase (NAD(P)+)
VARVGVAGTTSWGTTLAILGTRAEQQVTLWARTEEEAERLRSDGENSRLLPGFPIPDGITVTSSADEAFGDVDIAVIAVPSGTLRANARTLGGHIARSAVVVSATKGLELDTGKRMSEILAEELPPHLVDGICSLSGPNLAVEICQGKPSSTVIASPNHAAAERVQSIISSSGFRVYTNGDIIGVELAGSLKNIIALGAGVCDALDLGDNTKAAFMTRGLAEVARLGVAAGAEGITFAGLAGVGDLVATCSSPLSRNHQVGERVANGESLKDIRASMSQVAEGVDTTAAAARLADSLGVDMPITKATYEVLYNGIGVRDAITGLLGRVPAPEWAGVWP